MPPESPRRLLYLAPALLSSDSGPIRGVQVFDLLVVRQLVEMGIAVTLPAESTWRERLVSHLAGALPEFIYTPRLFKPQWNGLWAGLKLGGRTFDVTFVGNVSRGLIPMIRLLLLRRVTARLVIQANRRPRPAFARAMRPWPATVLAVSRSVAEAFPEDLRPRVQVHYGIANSELFRPRSTPRPPGQPIRFCVMGALDNTWKGAHLAVEAFRHLPPDLAARCELHLAAYENPPSFPEKNIIAYPWMKSEAVPEFLRGMDIMLVPSDDHETFSQVMVQGMLTGLPCITSALPVLTEKIDTGGGAFYTTIQEFAAHMASFAEDTARRESAGRAARETALARYVWDTRVFSERYLFDSGSRH
ncbi:MAG: glycosyltransferase family 4 protein [Phycisphaerae bacterium]|nr:glycosyltransferase family 4 protein [Phycisphaerae bacterium]